MKLLSCEATCVFSVLLPQDAVSILPAMMQLLGARRYYLGVRKLRPSIFHFARVGRRVLDKFMSPRSTPTERQGLRMPVERGTRSDLDAQDAATP